MLLKIYPDNPSQNQILKAVDILKNGGVIIYPTDSVYGLGCDARNVKAVEKVARIKGIQLQKANFSFLFDEISHVSDYAKIKDNTIFKIIKKNLPGPFTFILPATSNLPRFFKNKKKTIGIRIPDNNIVREIVKELGNPLISTSVHDDDEIIEYTTDPELIYENYNEMVDAVIDGGYGHNEPSTVIDFTGDEPEIIREGIGEIDF